MRESSEGLCEAKLSVSLLKLQQALACVVSECVVRKLLTNAGFLPGGSAPVTLQAVKRFLEPESHNQKSTIGSSLRIQQLTA